MLLKNVVFALFVLLVSGCVKNNQDPSWLIINQWTLNANPNLSGSEGELTQNFSEAWVYINDECVGVFELPVKIPILKTGSVNVKVYPGIKDNGIASQRVTYPFSHSDTSTIKLTIDSTTIISPIVALKENIEGIIDDFDPSYTFNYDTCFQKISGGPYGNYGSLSFLDSIFVTEINYKDHPLSFDNVTQQGSATYLELDYKSESEFLVGMYINFPNTPTLQKNLLWINPKDDWNKIYVNLTQSVSEAIGAESFSVFIRMQRDNFSEVKTLDFDNIRIVHYKK